MAPIYNNRGLKHRGRLIASAKRNAKNARFDSDVLIYNSHWPDASRRSRIDYIRRNVSAAALLSKVIHGQTGEDGEGKENVEDEPRS